jgi:DNA replication protein DnaC
MLNHQTTTQLQSLGLHGMLRVLNRQQDEPQTQKLSFDERFAMLLDAEVNDRDGRKIERLLKSAKLRQPSACLEDIDYRASREIDAAMIASLGDCGWIARRLNLVFTGVTGTGKSWLSCAFGKQACRSGYSVYFTTATQLFENLVTAQAEGSLPKLRRQLVKTQLLIIDDFGIGGIDVHLGPILLDIIDQQSMQGSLLITSQFPHEKWYDLFNDPTVADAILDRIVHRAHFMNLKGESMRKVLAKKT